MSVSTLIIFINHLLVRDFIAVRSTIIEIKYARTLKITLLHVVKLRTKLREILQVQKYPVQKRKDRFSYFT